MQVIAHSVGTWCAYEFLMLARARGLPMPEHVFLSAMAAPDIPEDVRPWRRNRDLDEESFKVRDFSAKHMGDSQCQPLLRMMLCPIEPASGVAASPRPPGSAVLCLVLCTSHRQCCIVPGLVSHIAESYIVSCLGRQSAGAGM